MPGDIQQFFPTSPILKLFVFSRRPSGPWNGLSNICICFQVTSLWGLWTQTLFFPLPKGHLTVMVNSHLGLNVFFNFWDAQPWLWVGNGKCTFLTLFLQAKPARSKLMTSDTVGSALIATSLVLALVCCYEAQKISASQIEEGWCFNSFPLFLCFPLL